MTAMSGSSAPSTFGRMRRSIFDSSPLFKYRIHGPDAEAFLAGVLARDVRTCPVGHGQYTAWLDDGGFVIEDGVVFRTATDDYLITCAEPNLAYFEDLAGRRRVEFEDVSETQAVLAIQGPKAREVLGCLTPAVADLPYFGQATSTIGGVPITISRTGYTGDLGYELWIPADRALAVWDAVTAAADGCKAAMEHPRHAAAPAPWDAWPVGWNQPTVRLLAASRSAARATSSSRTAAIESQRPW